MRLFGRCVILGLLAAAVADCGSSCPSSVQEKTLVWDGKLLDGGTGDPNTLGDCQKLCGRPGEGYWYCTEPDAGQLHCQIVCGA